MNFFAQKIVGIDFHDYSAELVELRMKNDKISLESYNRILIPPDVIKNGEIKKEDTLKIILTNLLQNSNPSPVETRSVATFFPSSKVLTHIFTFPANLKEDDIKKAIPYEAETVIPFAINDVYWDFTVLEKEGPNIKHASQSVFFACIPKVIADQYATVLEGAGLTPFLFGIQAETLRYAMLGQMSKSETCLIMEVGALSVNYVIVQNGIIRHFFGSNEGGKKLIADIADELQTTENSIFNKKEQGKLDSIGEIPKIKEFIEKNYRRAQKIIQEQEALKTINKVETVFLTGEFLNLPNFYKISKVYFPNQKIVIGDPKVSVQVDNQKFLPLQDSCEISVPYSIYFSNVMGIALSGLIRGRDGGINLLPDRLKESLSSRKSALFMAIATIVMSAFALFIATFFVFKHQMLNYERNVLVIQKEAIEKMIYGTRYQEIREEIVSFNTEVDELSSIDMALFSVPDAIEKIQKLIPKSIEINAIEFKDEDLSFSISGIADTRENLLKMKNNFESAEFISGVIAPISNYDAKTQISFSVQLFLDFTKLKKYGANTNT